MWYGNFPVLYCPGSLKLTVAYRQGNSFAWVLISIIQAPANPAYLSPTRITSPPKVTSTVS